MTDKPANLKPPTLAPMLSVRNGARAIDFYKAAFGAVELFRIDEGSTIAHLSIEGAEFWVADESPEHQNFSPETLSGSTVRLVLTVDNPDEVFDRAIAAGASIVWPVEDQDYGSPRRSVGPPLGNRKASQLTSPAPSALWLLVRRAPSYSALYRSPDPDRAASL